MSASQPVQEKATPYYYIPEPSAYPIFASVSMLITLIGAALWINSYQTGFWLFITGITLLFIILYAWFGQAITESEKGFNSKRVDVSYRWSMTWFIFSEVMFFSAFFGSLWYTRQITTPWLSNLDHQLLLWPGFIGTWPNLGPAGVVDAFKVVGPFWLPTINTTLLLISGLTLTIAHHALRADRRQKAMFWLATTIVLGFVFVGCQAFEYYHAYTDLNLRFDSGAYGALFYMLTGFHGFHVILGACFLTVILMRLFRGHFTADHHFGFEGAAWYWHFVDVVWLALYLFVYWF